MTDRAAIFQEWFAVGPAASRVLAALYDGEGCSRSHCALMVAGGQTMNGLHLTIKRLRDAMDAGSIANIFREGYRLTDAGLADCGRALADAAARERAA